MALLKKLVLTTAVLTVCLGYILYTPIPEGFSNPWPVRFVYSRYKLINSLSTIGHTLGLAEYHLTRRALLEHFAPSEGKDDALEIRDTQFDGVPVRIYTPKEKSSSSPGYVYYHGGGWVVGSIHAGDAFARRLAKSANMVVVSVGYRLAPEHIFPAGFDDCVTATKYFLKNAADFGVDAKRIGIGGNSAGGNLGAVVSLKLRDEKFVLRPKIQVLLYPVTQAVDFMTPSYQANADDAGLSLSKMGMYYTFYIQGHRKNDSAFLKNEHTSPGLKKKMASSHMDVSKLPKELISPDYVQPKTDYGDEKLFNELKHLLLNPYVSPLLADDLSGLPDAYVFTANNDVLRDEGIWYALRLKEAGVKVTHRNSDVGFHGIIGLSTFDEGIACFEDLIDYIKTTL